MAAPPNKPQWKFLTNHAQVLMCIAHDPGVRLREVSERIEITERAAHRIVAELVADGYIKRERRGRRNHYTIEASQPLPGRVGRLERVGDLLAILSDTSRSPDHADPPRPRRVKVGA
jgi:predicted ArsR family transcriptional regulator